jgi:diguanylate cyclase (GGDEF)-like protein
MKFVDPARYVQLKASGKLPSPKGVAFAILKLLQRDDYKTDELVRLIQSDPAVAGQLLKFANAAIYGRSRPVVALSQAVTTLGASRVKVLVLGFSVLQNNRKGNCSQFDYARFWSRALATAISAQELASYAKITSEENFTAGLLCCVGELALASIFPERYGEILYTSTSLDERLVSEQNAFETDRRELSASLLMEWGLPKVMADAVYHCENPDEAGLQDGSRGFLLTYSLHIALALAEICVAAEADRWAMAPKLFTKAARLGIGTDELTSIADGVIANWREWGKALEIQTQDISSFEELLASSPPRELVNSGSPGSTSVAPIPPSNLSVLVICTDSPESRDIGAFLMADSYKVYSTSNSKDGLNVALRDSPDLILLEISAPEIDGMAFCQVLRDTSIGRSAYIILLGKDNDECRLTQGLSAGADDFLVQPVTVQTLSSKLHTVAKVIQLNKEILKERNGLVRSAGEWAGANRRLIQVAMTDPLTHLPNRRHGMDFLAAEWVFARANNLPLACMMIDLDHFKLINDQYGHEAGDFVLATLANLLQSTARSEDMAFRYGGEEFCVVCPGANLAMARVIAERIRQSTAAETFRFRDMKIDVTVSIGVAATEPPYTSDETLIRDADAALYRAKEAGRNQVACMSQ